MIAVAVIGWVKLQKGSLRIVAISIVLLVSAQNRDGLAASPALIGPGATAASERTTNAS